MMTEEFPDLDTTLDQQEQNEQMKDSLLDQFYMLINDVAMITVPGEANYLRTTEADAEILYLLVGTCREIVATIETAFSLAEAEAERVDKGAG